ncbi:SLC13 family permease [Pseudactinotalea sp.]|uniref:SLC13 family permease n=1 Tax=Pseudactinotalea sp. TaxID=1926260 RepID=UPI003B3ACF64
MSDVTLSLLILAGTVAMFIWNRVSVGLVAVMSALALYATGVVDASTAIGGFGEPIVVFIAGLFIISEGLDASGLTAWMGKTLVRHAGTGRAALLLGLTALAALLAAFVTPNGAAAALLPVTVTAARRAGLLPSDLLMPVAFAASAGALLLLSGSTVNVIVSDALLDVAGTPFGYGEFALIGAPLVVVTIAVCLLLGPRLLPHREPEGAAADLSRHVETVVDHYELRRGFYRLAVPHGSAALGTSAAELVDGDVVAIGVQRADGSVAGLDEPLATDDAIVVSGESVAVEALRRQHALAVTVAPMTASRREGLLSYDDGVVEVVIPPRSRLVGEEVFPGKIRSGLMLLTVSRFGRSRGPRTTTLQEGDLMLLHGPWSAVSDLTRDSDVLPVNDPDLVRRQNAPLGRRAWWALAVLAVTVVLLATGVVTPAIAALVGAGLMVLTRVVTPAHAYRAVSWQTVVLIGGLIPLSVAITESGAADVVAGGLVTLVAGADARVLLALLFLLTVVLGQVISNTATVLIVAPVALASAAAAGVAPAPVLMLVAVAGAASFLTPIATPANMIVMGTAGYRFGDYWKLGAAITLAWFAVAVLVIPLIWAV